MNKMNKQKMLVALNSVEKEMNKVIAIQNLEEDSINNIPENLQNTYQNIDKVDFFEEMSSSIDALLDALYTLQALME